jgi:hypothetical protein
MIEKENVLRILRETSHSIREGDALHLKDLSNQTIHSSSTAQDSISIAVAVIVYSLSKIVEREEYRKEKGWEHFYKKVITYIDSAVSAIEKDDIKELKRNLKLIRTEIDELSGNLKIYIEDVFRKAKINKASKIYEHGISMEKTAKLLGISLWELANYAGQKSLALQEPESQTINVSSRIKLAEEFFQ